MTDHPPRRTAWGLVGALLCATLAACSLTRSPPVKETYLLEPAMPPVVARTQPLSVRVSGVNIAAPFRGRQFIYRMDTLRYETDYYSEFLVAPAAMLTEQTVRALSASRAFSRVVPPGPDNPMGSRALYLYSGGKDTLFRIHGTNQPEYIGASISSGCIRMTNEDVIDLYDRVGLGTVVVVLEPKHGDSPYNSKMALQGGGPMMQ